MRRHRNYLCMLVICAATAFALVPAGVLAGCPEKPIASCRHRTTEPRFEPVFPVDEEPIKNDPKDRFARQNFAHRWRSGWVHLDAAERSDSTCNDAATIRVYLPAQKSSECRVYAIARDAQTEHDEYYFQPCPAANPEFDASGTPKRNSSGQVVSVPFNCPLEHTVAHGFRIEAGDSTNKGYGEITFENQKCEKARDVLVILICK